MFRNGQTSASGSLTLLLLLLLVLVLLLLLPSLLLLSSRVPAAKFSDRLQGFIILFFLQTHRIICLII
jgi:hypothetical protein